MKEGLNRVSISGKIIDLLWADDEFYREVSSLKKAQAHGGGKFPKCDQWCDEAGFHMAFALAGYSTKDIRVQTSGYELYISGVGTKKEGTVERSAGDEMSTDDYPVKNPNIQIQQGMIVRGIARRNFKTKYFMSPEFDLSRAAAFMNNGLLEVVVPRSETNALNSIDITEK